MLNFSTDYVKSDHHKAVNQASQSVESLEHHRSKVKISVFEKNYSDPYLIGFPARVFWGL